MSMLNTAVTERTNAVDVACSASDVGADAAPATH
jgi:hypothetical protein